MFISLLPYLPGQSDNAICVGLMPLRRAQDNGNEVAKRIDKQSAKIGVYRMDDDGHPHPGKK